MSKGVDRIGRLAFGLSVSGSIGEGTEMSETLLLVSMPVDQMGFGEWRPLPGETREWCVSLMSASFAGQSRPCLDLAACHRNGCSWASTVERIAKSDSRRRNHHLTSTFARLKGHAWPL